MADRPSPSPSPSSSAQPVARRSARPIPGKRLPAALPGARLAARTAPRGARELATRPRTGSLDQIRAAKRTLVVTFRRDGTPVPTPVWAAYGDGALYVRSERSSGKLKRLRRDTRVLLAPCTVRGRPLGAPLEAHGALAPAELEVVAEQALSARYGLGRELFERTMDLLRVDMCYLRIVPGEWEQQSAQAAAGTRAADADERRAPTNEGGAMSR